MSRNRVALVIALIGIIILASMTTILHKRETLNDQRKIMEVDNVKEEKSISRPTEIITYKQNYGELKTYYEVVPKIDEKVTDPLFWIANLENSNDVIMEPEQITEFNRRNVETCGYMVDLREMEEIITKTELIKKIEGVSYVPKTPRYNSKGQQLTDEDYIKMKNNLNLGNIGHNNEVRYGVTWKRTKMKAFPSHEEIYTKPGDLEFDIFMETAVYPIEPVAIYHESADGQWYFAQMYNYLGWVPKEDIAIAEKDTIFRYLNYREFLVVKTSQMEIEVNGVLVLYDMGVKIPIIGNFEDTYIAIVPQRDNNGKLKLNSVTIPKDDNVHLDFLPYTKGDVVRQAFEFHGERYGWGGMFDARDCSAFIMDIYRSFGINLPRNASQQGRDSYGVTYSSHKLIPVTPVYMTGHTMLYLGEYNGEHYVIHDFAGFYSKKNNGELKYEKVMRVLVTPLSIHSSHNRTFKESLYGGREFRLTD